MNTSITDRLTDLLDAIAIDGSRHEQAVIMVKACLVEGGDEGSEIIKTLEAVGFNPKHDGLILRKLRGPSEQRHEWAKLPDGRYRAYD